MAKQSTAPTQMGPVWARLIWPLALATTIVFASGGTVQTPEPLTWLPSHDKWIHFAVFGLLATLLARVTPRGLTEPARFGSHWLFPILATCLFGLADEVHQYTTLGRYFELADWLADTLGALVAVAVYNYWGGYRRLLECSVRFKAHRQRPTCSGHTQNSPPAR